MTHAALSVVFARDDAATLRARVAHLERSREDLCWLQQGEHVCEYVTSRESILDHVYELLVWPIEQQRWGLREYVVADGLGYDPGRLSFNRDEHDFGYDLERTIMELLAESVLAVQSIERYMRAVEYELGLPHGSLVRLSADAEFR